MDLDQQIQVLIDQAPPDGTTSAAIEAIAPALTSIAGQLKHPQYYILQSLEQSWVVTTLSNQHQPNMTKNVIYAYPTLKDAAGGSQALKDPNIIALPVPVTHILFQMLALQSLDSMVFFESPGNLQQGAEVTRQTLQELVQLCLQQMRAPANIPPDIA